MHQVGTERRGEAGFTFAEITFAMLILVTAAVVLVDHLSVNYRTTATERDRVFAYSKAQAILAEIQGYVDRGQADAAVDLDVLDDGVTSRMPLTIQTDAFGALVPADHVVSGNWQRNGQWVWSRRITVQPFLGLNNRNVRYVTVRIFKRGAGGAENPMADLSAVINSAGTAFPTTQEFDLYLLAVENIPGWWVYMDSIKPFVESMITDLENRNPGLSFRSHWITKAAFGRNQAYRPYTNDTTDSYAVINEVFHYPGRMPAGNSSAYYYVPDNIKARINVDGLERNGYDPVLNREPYSLADFFNHAMRYPDELELWQRRVALVEQREAAIRAAKALGMSPPPELEDMSKEPTLRLFLEDLCTNPDKYKNALIINLHGELMPMPALRNYSDAAREPVSYPEIRVVTHPEELRTRNNEGGVTENLRLRVYAYTSNAATYSGPPVMVEPMVVEIVGLDLRDPGDPDKLCSDCKLVNVPGGVMVAGSNEYPSAWLSAKHSDDGPAANEMYYTLEYVDHIASGGEPFTRIFLHNTPVVAPMDINARGIAATKRARLYGMDYIPAPINNGPAFTTDLTSIGIGPKNTARWVLSLEPDVLTNYRFVSATGTPYNPPGDVRLKIRTRIASGITSGDDSWKSSGRTWPNPVQPDNLSVTYAWWTDSAEDVPFTERAQFNGDPRHLPYRDCFNGAVDFPNTYNWYHDALTNGGENGAADFPSINAGLLRNRWQSAMSCDVPRYFELLRKGLVRSAAVYTTLTGWSYYYLGIGNDIGYDAANGYPNSIPSNLRPHGVTGNGFINTITGARRFVRQGGSGYWWGIPWLGELYPDAAASTWLDTTGGSPRGNLPSGTGTSQYFQSPCNPVYAGGGRLAFGTSILNHHQRTANNGCSCFFNIGTNATAFRHVGSSGDGTLTAVGSEIAGNYNMTMPAAAPISRPFSLTQPGGGGEHWNSPPYSTERFSGVLYRTYYTHGAGTGSALVKLQDPGLTSAAYIVVNGIDKTVDAGTTFIAKWALLSLVHSFFEAGSTTNTLRIPQLPRIEIESPTDITELQNPATIEIQYAVDWVRWDGQPYALTGSYAEDELQLRYVIMYSRDNGETWLHIQDNSPAIPGVRPTNPAYLVDDQGAGAETYDWNVPALMFPAGSYLLRIDCYRQGAQVHYSFHQNKIFIQR